MHSSWTNRWVLEPSSKTKVKIVMGQGGKKSSCSAEMPVLSEKGGKKIPKPPSKLATFLAEHVTAVLAEMLRQRGA